MDKTFHVLASRLFGHCDDCDREQIQKEIELSRQVEKV